MDQQHPPALAIPLHPANGPLHPANGGAGAGGGGQHELRQTHLTKFAFLLSSARGEGSDEPVVGMHHDVEMAACFSQRHLGGSGNVGGGWRGVAMPVTPPSISSSSLSMQSKNGHCLQAAGEKKAGLMEMAAENMSTPFYTTPDTVSSTSKTILKNIVVTMEELMDSRLRSTVCQLVNKSGRITNSQIVCRLLSPSRNPIQVATVITRFVLPDSNDENNASGVQQQATDEMISIPLQFKAVIDIKIFGAVSTVELCCPVTMSGKFCPQDGLLTAVDVKFDCVRLLKSMISRGRAVVKTAVTKAAALGVQIAEWHVKKKAEAGAPPLPTSRPSAQSFRNFLENSSSMTSMGNSDGGSSALSSLFTSISSMSSGNKGKTKGLLKNHNHLRNNNNNNNAMSTLLTSSVKMERNNNANATFDFGGAGANNNNVNAFTRTSSTNTVRFQNPIASRNSPPMAAASASPATLQALQFQKSPSPEQPVDKGNIHHGLFSWLQDDKMFLTEEKIQEQNAANAERERKRREAPMPLRFFTAAEDLGGGQSGLEIVSNSIFGQGASSESNNKRRQQSQAGPCQQKGKTAWQ